jgi:hypothetical protein
VTLLNVPVCYQTDNCDVTSDNHPFDGTVATSQRFIMWNGMYVHRHEGPLAGADKDPPSDIFNLITEEKSLTDHAQEVSRAILQAFLDVACMAIHPQLFDYPAENGGCGVRKTTPTTIAPSLGPPSLEEALRLVVAAFCSLDEWLGRFSNSKLPTLKKQLKSNSASVGESECAEDPLS